MLVESGETKPAGAARRSAVTRDAALSLYARRPDALPGAVHPRECGVPSGTRAGGVDHARSVPIGTANARNKSNQFFKWTLIP